MFTKKNANKSFKRVWDAKKKQRQNHFFTIGERIKKKIKQYFR